MFGKKINNIVEYDPFVLRIIDLKIPNWKENSLPMGDGIMRSFCDVFPSLFPNFKLMILLGSETIVKYFHTYDTIIL